MQYRKLSRKLRTVNDPKHPAIKRFAGAKLIFRNRRILELNYNTATSLDVGNMFLAGCVIEMNDLAALRWKFGFPGPMPIRLILPPKVAITLSDMCPMPQQDCSALR